MHVRNPEPDLREVKVALDNAVRLTGVAERLMCG